MNPVIDPTLLRAVQKVIVHRNGPASQCPDGVASALLIRAALPDAQIVFASYDDLATLPAEPHMLFCDLSPPESRLVKFYDARAIVLDHHEKQANVTKVFALHVAHDEPGCLGVYGESKVGWSGATLAYEHVFLPLCGPNPDAKHFAALAAVRDTWRKDDPSWDLACAQAEALRFWPWEEWPIDPWVQEEPTTLNQMLAIGPVLVRRHAEQVEANAAETHHATVGNLHIGIVNTTDTSDLAERLRKDGIDILIGFRFVGHPHGPPKLRLSFRSRGELKRAIIPDVWKLRGEGIDVGAIAKSLGGGGHAQAAGATVGAPDEEVHHYLTGIVRRALFGE